VIEADRYLSVKWTEAGLCNHAMPRAGLVRHLTANKASRWLVPWLVYFSPGGAQTPKGCVMISVPVQQHHSSSPTINGGKNCGRSNRKTDSKTLAPRDSTSNPCWVIRNWLIWFGRLGMRGLLSELSIPWNREQTDSLTQGIIEAGPRYQNEIGRPSKRVGLFIFGALARLLNLHGREAAQVIPRPT